MLVFAMGYEHLDASGDARVRAVGATLEEAFADAALGMYGLITESEGVNAQRSVNVRVEGRSMEGLLVGWLNELVFLFDAYGFIGREVVVNELRDGKIDAAIKGENFDPARHGGHALIKAATYHDLRVEERAGGGWLLEVTFDI